MDYKKYIVCFLCNESQCLEKECIVFTAPDQITRGMKNTLNILQNSTRGMNNLANLKYRPAYIRKQKKYKPWEFLQGRKFSLCYFCSETQCLDKDCIFRSVPDHLTEHKKNILSSRYIPFDTTESPESKGISFQTLYIHGVKLFWLILILVIIIYVPGFWGIPLLAATYSMQSQLPLQLYIGIFVVGVTMVCLVLANLFGTDSETA